MTATIANIESFIFGDLGSSCSAGAAPSVNTCAHHLAQMSDGRVFIPVSIVCRRPGSRPSPALVRSGNPCVSEPTLGWLPLVALLGFSGRDATRPTRRFAEDHGVGGTASRPCRHESGVHADPRPARRYCASPATSVRIRWLRPGSAAAESSITATSCATGSPQSYPVRSAAMPMQLVAISLDFD